MKMRYKSLTILVAAAIGIAFAVPAMADVTSKADYKDALKTAKANYKAAYSACPPAAGSDRLACRRKAHEDWDKATADAREAHGLPRIAPGPRN